MRLSRIFSTDKPAEIERTVSKLRGDLKRVAVTANSRKASLPELVDCRESFRSILMAAGNALVCSLLYSNEVYRRQLEGVQKNVAAEMASLETRLKQRTMALLKSKEILSTAMTQTVLASVKPTEDAGYTVIASENGPIPVYYMRYAKRVDAAGYTHPSYTMWFKSGKEFCTSFSDWPPANRWIKLSAATQLKEAVETAIVNDGFALERAA